MPSIENQSQILIRLAAIIVCDFALVGWIVVTSISGDAPSDDVASGTGRRKLSLWLSLSAVAAAGLIFALFLIYAVLG